MRISKIDIYIIKQIFFTFIFSIIAVISISLVIDVSEKVDVLFNSEVAKKTSFLDYFYGFIIFIGNMLFPMFTLISIVIVTNKMNQRNEITAILSSGISFVRLLFPFMLGTSLIVLLSFIINLFLLAGANEKRVYFENYHTNYSSYIMKQYMEVVPGTLVSYNSFNLKDNNTVSSLWIDNFKIDSNGKYNLIQTIKSNIAIGDSIANKWQFNNCIIVDYKGNRSILRNYNIFDTILNFKLQDLGKRMNVISTYTTNELWNLRREEIQKGSSIVPAIEIEIYTRTAQPLSLFVISLIGVCISITPDRRKVGRIILLAIFALIIYFIFNRFGTVYAIKSGFNTLLAVWFPIILLSIFAIYLYRKTPK